MTKTHWSDGGTLCRIWDTWTRLLTHTRAAQAGALGGLRNLALLTRIRGDDERAVQLLRQAVLEGDDGAHLPLADAFADLQRFGEAEDEHGEAARQGSALALVELGVMLREVGNLVRAEDAYRRAYAMANAARCSCSSALFCRTLGASTRPSECIAKGLSKTPRDVFLNLGNLLAVLWRTPAELPRAWRLRRSPSPTTQWVRRRRQRSPPAIVLRTTPRDVPVKPPRAW